MQRLDFAIREIRFARNYTNELLTTIHIDDWFRMPHEPVTHFAWQVGHLAMAQYRMCLERLRGKMPEDDTLIPATYFTLFGKNSKPSPNRHLYPDPAAIVEVFDNVHRQVLKELPSVPDLQLDQVPLAPHRLCTTQFDCLLWSAHHEMLHVGQIGLLRRLFGEAPLAR